MRSIAFVFPGQGSQYVGMGHALAERYPDAAYVFETANTFADGISTLAFAGPEEDLNQTTNSQPAILAMSIAYLRALLSTASVPKPAFLAGHSMGQYSAMVAAGVLPLVEAVRLVRERGR